MKDSNDVVMTWRMRWLNRSVATINVTLQLLDIYIWCLNVLIILIFWYRMQMEALSAKCKLIGWFWTALTSLHNLGITLSSKLQLRWFMMLWNTKTKLYNFHVLSFKRYGLHQGRNWAWSCCTCIADVLECSFAWNSNTSIWCGLFLEASRSDARNFQLKNTTFLVILGLFSFFFNIFP